jgi:hypothetical protein
MGMNHVFSSGAYRVRDPFQFQQELCAAIPRWEPGMKPIRLVVSSSSLRQHWHRALVQHRGAVLGVVIQTHAELAREILSSDGFVPIVGTTWPDELVRHFGCEEPVFERSLGALDDGYRVLAGPVYELIDAGLEPALREGVLESVVDWPQNRSVKVGSGVAPRIAALVRVASNVAGALDEGPYMTPGQAARKAAERIKRKGVEALSAHHICVVGFSDATGAVAELITALHDYLGATVAVDVAADPTIPNQIDPGVAYAASFHGRFEGRWRPEEAPFKVQENWHLRFGRDPIDEMGQVAHAIAGLLDEGAIAEDIAVIARSLPGYDFAIKNALGDRGVPFSGIGATLGGSALSRRASAVASVLLSGDLAEAGRWADARGGDQGGRVGIAFDACGIRLVTDILNRFADDEAHVRLPSRSGLVQGESGPRSQRFLLHNDRVLKIREAATTWLARLEAWPENGTAAEHWAFAQECLVKDFCISNDSEIMHAVKNLSRQIPLDTSLHKDAALRILATAIAGVGAAPLGGCGGGVQILDGVESRGRTFEHVFIVGLNRGLFPRIVSEEAVMPDAARWALQKVLPDVREKRLGVDEERFLFARLCQSGACVHLSYAQVDLSGSVLHPSSLVIGLQLAKVVGEPETPQVVPQGQRGRATTMALQNHSLGSAMSAAGATPGFTALLTNKRKWNSIFEPYTGAVGSPRHAADLRHRPLYVTQVESTARCPWRTFLQKELGLERRPNPWGPLPSVSTHLVGRVVHSVAERVARAALGDGLETTSVGPVPIVWPSESTLSQWIIEESEHCLADDGVGWMKFSVAVVPPALAALKLLQEEDGSLEGVSGVEVEGSWAVSPELSIGFRADRMEYQGGVVNVTDLKLGKPPTLLKTESKRDAAILTAVRQGVLLQGAVYAHAVKSSVGRYLYLHPDPEIPVRSFSFSAEDSLVSEALHSIVNEVMAVRNTGAWFPRVSEFKRDKVPVACGYCDVKEACSVGDSSFRRRMMALANEEGEGAISAARFRLWSRGQREQNS